MKARGGSENSRSARTMASIVSRRISSFDEKIGGTIHIALGAGYPETGSKNQSAIHWDMICDIRDGGRVTVDGQPFLVDGKYVV